jgi:hypothetical protein
MVSELYETDKERENLDPNDHYDMRMILNGKVWGHVPPQLAIVG